MKLTQDMIQVIERNAEEALKKAFPMIEKKVKVVYDSILGYRLSIYPPSIAYIGEMGRTISTGTGLLWKRKMSNLFYALGAGNIKLFEEINGDFLEAQYKYDPEVLEFELAGYFKNGERVTCGASICNDSFCSVHNWEAEQGDFEFYREKLDEELSEEWEKLI